MHLVPQKATLKAWLSFCPKPLQTLCFGRFHLFGYRLKTGVILPSLTPENNGEKNDFDHRLTTSISNHQISNRVAARSSAPQIRSCRFNHHMSFRIVTALSNRRSAFKQCVILKQTNDYAGYPII